jgi:hypothetical protein
MTRYENTSRVPDLSQEFGCFPCQCYNTEPILSEAETEKKEEKNSVIKGTGLTEKKMVQRKFTFFLLYDLH